MSKGAANWRTLAVACGSGALFAIGLALGRMTRPSKVIGFLDVTGAWDASLAFVMGGALGSYALGYRFVRKWDRPFFCEDFSMPLRRRIDPQLISGAVLFGAGWGVAGFCPGPALVSLSSLDWRALLFGAAMLVGMAAFRLTSRALNLRSNPAAADA